jgi:hypothetical protein
MTSEMGMLRVDVEIENQHGTGPRQRLRGVIVDTRWLSL